MAENVALTERVRRGLEKAIEDSIMDPRLPKNRGPNPTKTKLLKENMALIHELLESMNQSEIIKRLADSGVETTRQTLVRLYKDWAIENKKPLRVKSRKKKGGGKSLGSSMDNIMNKVTINQGKK